MRQKKSGDDMEKVKVCVPITGQSRTEIEQQARAIATTDADVVEWRFDLATDLYHPFMQPKANADARDAADDDGTAVGIGETSGDISQQNIHAMITQLQALLPGKELLFTIRTKCQGGSFPNDAVAYRTYCASALTSGGIDYLDLEDTTPVEDSHALIALAHEMGVQVIGSYHDFVKTPAVEEIIEKLSALRAMGVDILKTAYMPRQTSDVAALLMATARFREEDLEKHPLITMSMGEIGQISRLVGGAFGSMLTFATVGECSAPGQMPIEEVRAALSQLTYC